MESFIFTSEWKQLGALLFVVTTIIVPFLNFTIFADYEEVE